MKTAFGFANWNVALGFGTAWLTWVGVDTFLIQDDIIDTSDGFAITCIFTIVSYIRVYILNSIQIRLNKDNEI